MKADLIIKNAEIYTVNHKMPKAEAIAIRDDKIIGVGAFKDVELLLDDRTEVIDAGERMVMPGFIDAHAHPLLTPFLKGIEFEMEMDLDDMLKAIEKYVSENPDEDCYFGIGYNEPFVDPKRYTKEALDSACKDKPLLMLGATLHEGWVNSKALEMAGIDKDYPDPTPGKQYFCRDENGEPTGRVIDLEPFAAVADKVMHFNLSEAGKEFEALLDKYRKLGITTVAECGLFSPVRGEDAAALLEQTMKQGNLTCRLFGCHAINSYNDANDAIGQLKALNEKFHDDMVCFRTLKIIQDGCIEARSASCFDKFEDFDEMCMPILYGEELQELSVDAAKNRFDIHIHGLGDKAIYETLMAAKRIREEGYADTRVINAHCHIVRDEDIELFSKYNVIANSTPQWFVWRQCNEDALGKEKAEKLLRIKTLMDTGAVVTFGSDYPSDELGMEPVKALEMATTRQKYGQRNDRIFIESERITMEKAIEAFTINAAYQLRMEDKLGSIEEGKYADIIILDRNLFEIDPYQIHETQVVTTIFNGKVVHNELDSEEEK